jgi:hypothetical protein
MNIVERIRNSAWRGFLSGLSTAWLLIKVMVPTMAVVQVLKVLGVLGFLAREAAPFMKYFGLPGEASLALLTGGLVNIYAAIAVAVNIPMTAKSMTVLAIMVLIAHNLIVETAVQSKTGTPAAIMLITRLSAAFLAGLLFGRIIPEKGGTLLQNLSHSQATGMKQVIMLNAISLAKIAAIVISLMILVEMFREFGLMDRLMSMLHWPMRVLGLDRKTAFVTAVGLVLGLAYGSGLIIEESRRNSLTKKEVLATNVFLGTNHALIEDSLVFAAVGANLVWIVIGRLIFGSVYLRLAVPLAAKWVKDDSPGKNGETGTIST